MNYACGLQPAPTPAGSRMISDAGKEPNCSHTSPRESPTGRWYISYMDRPWHAAVGAPMGGLLGCWGAKPLLITATITAVPLGCVVCSKCNHTAANCHVRLRLWVRCKNHCRTLSVMRAHSTDQSDGDGRPRLMPLIRSDHTVRQSPLLQSTYCWLQLCMSTTTVLGSSN
jgi:hypothetical protein